VDNVVPAKDDNLEPWTTEMVTFCQQNWKALNVGGWSVEKLMAEEQAQGRAEGPILDNLAEAGLPGMSQPRGVADSDSD